MSSHIKGYIPALGLRWLTPFYDPLLRWGMREETFKQRLLERADLRDGMRVLDLGCGTGTLAAMIKQRHPTVEVIGLDGDPRILEIADQKARRVGVEITWDQGLANQLPYPDNTLDCVVSSLVFHHLTRSTKRLACGEVYRVLRPGGRFLLLDFGMPFSPSMHFAAGLIRRFERAGENIDGLLPGILREAGFEQVTETDHFSTIFGPLSLYQGIKL